MSLILLLLLVIVTKISLLYATAAAWLARAC